jgi:hypothetical protein
VLYQLSYSRTSRMTTMAFTAATAAPRTDSLAELQTSALIGGPVEARGIEPLTS